MEVIFTGQRMATISLHDIAKMLIHRQVVMDNGVNLPTEIHIFSDADTISVAHNSRIDEESDDRMEHWILPCTSSSAQELNFDTLLTLVRYRAELKNILDKPSCEISNDIDFGMDSHGQLRLSPYVCGMEKGSPSGQDNPCSVEFANYVEKQIVEREDSLILSNPLSVTRDANKFLGKNLVDDSKQQADRHGTLQSEELSMHFNNGQYYMVVSQNRKEIVYSGNYERSFLCVVSENFDKVKKELSSLPGVRMIGELTDYEKTELINVDDAVRSYRIEFDSFKSFDHALHAYALKYGFTKFPLLNNPLLPTTTKQFCLKMKWFFWPSKRQALIVLDKEELSHCISVLEVHNFLVYDVTSRCYQENAADAHIIIKAKSSDMLLKIWHYEDDLKDVMQKILGCNDICYKRISLLRKRQQDVERGRTKIITEVNSRIIRSAHNCVGNVWSRQSVRTTKEVEEMARNWSQLPWDVILKQHNTDCVEAVIEVRFRDEDFGRTVADYMVPRSPDTGFFNLFKHDRIGVRIYPFYRITLPVPRNIIEACITDLSDCDLYYGDSEPGRNPVSLDRFESRNYFAKIIASSSIDALTIELWPERLIPGALRTINTVLEGRTVDCSLEAYSMLLSGSGLKWLLSLANLCAPYIVVAVDRLRALISIYGSANNTDIFMAILQFFCFNTNEYVITDIISLELPRFLPCMAQILSKVIERKQLCAMFGDISFSELDLSIIFRGSLKKLNELHVFLDDLNENVFVNSTPSVRLLCSRDPCFTDFPAYRPICPVCLCSVQTSAYCLTACGHYYCLDCLREQIIHQTRTRVFPWCCLSSPCEEEILMSDIKELLCLGRSTPLWFGQRDLQQLLRPLRDWIIRDPSSGYFGCETPRCEGIFKKIAGAYVSQEDDQKVDQPSAVCADCGVTRCLNCLQPDHDGISCWKSANLTDDVDASLAHFMDQNANARYCPNASCGAVILKDAGCNHVCCPYCKTHICWICFKSFDTSRSAYGHMHSAHGGFGGGWVIENDIIVDRPREED